MEFEILTTFLPFSSMYPPLPPSLTLQKLMKYLTPVLSNTT